ncbi:MAG: sulfotransferase family 2 domain-containing protein [Parachlamydiaceae bacterium]|nr:sulfotransferase family 2 domain-containing protein [Parachlamydiaceae bacterium]
MFSSIRRHFLKLFALTSLIFTFELTAENVHQEVNTDLLNNNIFKKYAITASDSHHYIWFRNAKVCTRTIFDVLIKNSIFSLNTDSISFKNDLFQGYFKFAFVRNPWDRVVSCYLNKVVNNSHPAFKECFGKGFDYFIYFIFKQDLSFADRHIQLQSDLIPLGKLDFIGRFENFEEDFRTILNFLNISCDEIPHKNSTNHQHYSTYYNDMTRELIRQKYLKDIRTFNYRFEVPSN